MRMFAGDIIVMIEWNWSDTIIDNSYICYGDDDDNDFAACLPAAICLAPLFPLLILAIFFLLIHFPEEIMILLMIIIILTIMLIIMII